MPDFVRSGRRVVLRDWRPEDVAPYRIWQAPGHPWQSLDAPYLPRPDEVETNARVDRIAERIERRDWPTPRVVVVVADAETDAFLGTVSRYWQSEETHWLSIGIGLYDPALWGRGLGTEALSLWMDYLFDALPEITRLDLRTWSGNRGMMRLAEKLGYRLEGCFRKARIVDGRHYDGLAYGILREEWDASRGLEGEPS